MNTFATFIKFIMHSKRLSLFLFRLQILLLIPFANPLPSFSNEQQYQPGSIKRMTSLYSRGSAAFSYGGLASAATCTQTDVDNVYVCVTKNDTNDWPNSVLFISMDQKLMFIFTEKRQGPCSGTPSVTALYDDSQRGYSTMFNDADWSQALKVNAKDYNTIMGCDPSRVNYKFNDEKWAWNMRWRMPWNGNMQKK